MPLANVREVARVTRPVGRSSVPLAGTAVCWALALPQGDTFDLKVLRPYTSAPRSVKATYGARENYNRGNSQSLVPHRSQRQQLDLRIIATSCLTVSKGSPAAPVVLGVFSRFFPLR